MSRELLAFLLSELGTVRIVCRGDKQGNVCGAVLEVCLTDLDTLYQRVSCCPVCGNPLGIYGRDGVAQDGFGPLFRAIESLNAVSQRFQVEFVLPRKD